MLVVHYGPVVCYGTHMNLKPAPAATLRAAFAKGTRNALWLFVPFALIAVALWQMPVNHNVVAPEHGAAAEAGATKAERQHDRAMAKCETLPANTLPTAAVVQWVEGGYQFTTDAETVGAAFDIALGETTDPAVAGVTLCR